MLNFHIVVDGIVYGFQRYGGINTMFNEMLPRLAAMPGVRVEVAMPPCPIGELPSWPVHRITRSFFPVKTGLSWKLDTAVGPILERLNDAIRTWRVASRSRCVFQSTYFTQIDARVPQVATAYDMNHEIFSDLALYQGDWGLALRKQYRIHLTESTRVVAISRATKNDLIRWYGLDADRIDVIHLAVNPQAFWRDPEASRLPSALREAYADTPYLLYVGLRSEYKNFSRLIKAFAASDFSRIGLLAVAGSAFNDQEAKEIEERGLRSRIVSIVHPPTDLLRALYSCATAFVFPSFGEGFGIPVLEAMACGAPVLLASIPVFHEVAADAALFFDPFDCDDMTRCVDSSLDAERRHRLSNAGFLRVAEFSWERSARQMATVYQKALEDVGG